MAYNNNSYYNPYYYNGATPDMLGQFKNPYQQTPMPTQNQPIQQPMPQPVVQNTANDMIWVQGESGAKAYLVAPNTTVTLWDSENPVIYIKTADASGMPSMRVLDFTERAAETSTSPAKHVCQCGKDFVKKNEFEALQVEIDAIKERLDALASKPTTKSNKKGESE